MTTSPSEFPKPIATNPATSSPPPTISPLLISAASPSRSSRVTNPSQNQFTAPQNQSVAPTFQKQFTAPQNQSVAPTSQNQSTVFSGTAANPKYQAVFGLTEPTMEDFFINVVMSDSNLDTVLQFLNLRSGGNKTKILCWILFVKTYSFIPDNSNETKSGISFTFAEPITRSETTDSPNQKGAKVDTYSIATNNPRAIFDNMPKPPFLAIAELEFCKKNTRLIQIYSIQDMVQKPTMTGYFQQKGGTI